MLCATLGSTLLACGSNNNSGGSGGDPLTLLPVDNTVSGWTINTAENKSKGEAPSTGTNLQEVTGLIDGGAESYYVSPYSTKLFIWQNYKNSSLPDAPVSKDAPYGATAKLYVCQMPSADQASGIYKAVLDLSEYSRNKGTSEDWKPTEPTLGTESRIQDTRTQWWINYYHGSLYVEMVFEPSNGPAPDYTPGLPELKTEAMRFAKEVASKL
jgi:hypothetical protein